MKLFLSSGLKDRIGIFTGVAFVGMAWLSTAHRQALLVLFFSILSTNESNNNHFPSPSSEITRC
jgi:hypothetical protein